MYTTGEIIRKLRMEKIYTQTELASMLGVKLSTLQKYENGAIQNLKLETIRELCHIFNVPSFVFIFPEDVEPLLGNGKPLIQTLGNGFTMKCWKNPMLLNCEGRKKLIDYTDDLLATGRYNL